MKKVLTVVLGIALVVMVGAGIALILLSARTDADFSGQITRTIGAACPRVEALLLDVEGRQDHRHEVVGIEQTGMNTAGLATWTETMDLGGEARVEIARHEPGRLVAIRLIESSFGMTGTWTYEFTADGASCIITIRESSSIESWFVRAMYGLSGRDAMLRNEMAVIENHVAQP